nr:hypothetical protein BaRGS_029726 [Batillaria attramentaria]
MELSEDQQHELFMLKKFKPHQLPDPRPLPPDASEPFDRDAISFLRHDPEEVPNTCRGRYLAEGRIADQGFRKPTWCRTHFIVFSEEFFGVFWLDLYSFSVFRRVAEDLGDPF